MSDGIIGAIIGALAMVLVTLIGKWFDRRINAASARDSDSQTLLNLQTVADNAVKQQEKLQRKIDELQAAKQADYDLHVIFTLGPPPAVRKATLKAIDPASVP